MGIKVEFNPDLALRNIAKFRKGERKKEECLPARLVKNRVYKFLKREQRNYWLYGEIPLLETQGGQILSRPKASVRILSAEHFLMDGEVYTRGKYKVMEVFNDDKIHFDGFNKLK